MKFKTFAGSVAVTLVLAGCATQDRYETKYAGLSCSQLDQRLGAAEEKLKYARYGQIGSVITDIANGSKDDVADGLTTMGYGIDEEDAKNRVEAVRELKYRRGCR